MVLRKCSTQSDLPLTLEDDPDPDKESSSDLSCSNEDIPSSPLLLRKSPSVTVFYPMANAKIDSLISMVDVPKAKKYLFPQMISVEEFLEITSFCYKRDKKLGYIKSYYDLSISLAFTIS